MNPEGESPESPSSPYEERVAQYRARINRLALVYSDWRRGTLPRNSPSNDLENPRIWLIGEATELLHELEKDLATDDLTDQGRYILRSEQVGLERMLKDLEHSTWADLLVNVESKLPQDDPAQFDSRQRRRGILPAELGPAPWMTYATLAAELRRLDALMRDWVVEIYRLAFEDQSCWSLKLTQRAIEIRDSAQRLVGRAQSAIATALATEKGWLVRRILTVAQDIRLATQEHIDQAIARQTEEVPEKAPEGADAMAVDEPFDPDVRLYDAKFRTEQLASIGSLTTAYRDFMHLRESETLSMPGAVTYVEQVRLNLLRSLEHRQQVLEEYGQHPQTLASDRDWITLRVEELRAMHDVLTGQKPTVEPEQPSPQSSDFKPARFSPN